MPRSSGLNAYQSSSHLRNAGVWVADFTYVATWSGTVYVAFVLAAHSRRILGWRTATSMRTELVLTKEIARRLTSGDCGDLRQFRVGEEASDDVR